MARKQGQGKSFFEERLKKAINIAVRKDISDPRLSLVSITRVELNPDYSHAKVYWDTYDAGKRGDIKKAFEGIASRLRTILAKELKVRHTPSLELLYDAQFEAERAIEDLLSKSKNGKA
ncbi:MAG: 30S ribosome-binding factor RbfA [Halobacteriovoraceae bacterium]|jgi:ribosome-binding factor A|nr:30S ribosome-binding factor RbfA [Halobacteriovoraceae bacterium]